MNPLADTRSESETETVEGIVDSIIFRNDSNGFTVCAIDAAEPVVAVGPMPDLSEGDSVRLFGAWSEHAEFGRQFKAVRFEPIAPRSPEAITAYLSSGLIRGVGPKTALKLVRTFGQSTLKILQEQPEKVASIKGITRRQADRIAEQLREKGDYQELVLLLSPLGIGHGRILKIHKTWGQQAIKRIKDNPYLLAETFTGIGFLTADRLALALGMDPESPGRLAAAIRFWLGQQLQAGHTWMSRNSVRMETSRMLGIEYSERIDQAIHDLLEQNKLVALEIPDRQAGISAGSEIECQRLALPGVYRTERDIAGRLQTLLYAKPDRFPHWQKKQEAQRLAHNGRAFVRELSDEQTQALVTIIASQVSLLTGGPGTGKTTLIRALCQGITAEGGRVILAAPTGRAARRLAEATDMEASTLHRLLGLPVQDELVLGQTGVTSDSVTRLQADLVVVDETSMLDSFLFLELLRSIISGTRLLLVGDADQLPSIGPGQILRDLLETGRLPVVRLTSIFRQAGQSLIVRNAHQIRQGKWLELDQSMESDFIWIAKDTAEEMAEAVLQLCARILPEKYHCNMQRDVQVLSPIRKGAAGIHSLNERMQSLLNANPEKQLSSHGVLFACGDKVIQMKNQYDLTWRSMRSEEKGQGIMNGETGIVTALDLQAKTLTVLFEDDRVAVYDEAALEDLDLAYAITVHKSQGSEYPVVVLIVPPAAPALLSRPLIYTAVTRARLRLFLISSKAILLRAIHNDQSARRNTSLPKLLDFWEETS